MKFFFSLCVFLPFVAIITAAPSTLGARPRPDHEIGPNRPEPPPPEDADRVWKTPFTSVERPETAPYNGYCGNVAGAEQYAFPKMTRDWNLADNWKVPPGNCTRVRSLEYSGIYVCNHGNVTVGMGRDAIVARARALYYECGSKETSHASVSAQGWFEGDGPVSVVLAYANRLEPFVVQPGKYGFPGPYAMPFRVARIGKPARGGWQLLEDGLSALIKGKW